MIPYRHLIILLSFLILFLPVEICGYTEMKRQALQRLDTIRAEKKALLFDYLALLESKADRLASDEGMKRFFNIKKKYYRLLKECPPTEAAATAIENLKKEINRHYLQNYLVFHDILFIDRNGDIFYTIRKEADYHQNIFSGELAKTSLSKRLKNNPEKSFVDYQYYAVSGEPSAFIVKPVYEGDHIAGWFALQCAINKINSFFAYSSDRMGTTGEVFLVNRDNYMLTDSRFDGNSSILKKHLSAQNIDEKFRRRCGHKTVIDYRGYKALSSFEVCSVGGTEWLLIAKIDQDEIVSDLFSQRESYYAPRLSTYYKTHPVGVPGSMLKCNSSITVDMDEYRKSSEKKPLCTYGISTCTAIVVSFPGKFAYMGHLSNLDAMYGNKTTDITANILKHVKKFDIYQYELRNLEIIIAAPHTETLIPLLRRLGKEGIFLSQIRFFHSETADYGNLFHDYTTGETRVEWVPKSEKRAHMLQTVAETPTVSTTILNLSDQSIAMGHFPQ